ncbi:MAG: 3-methyl-2-oxobutanoate hydroxymethyltransferase [Burkholderiales bacterium]
MDRAGLQRMKREGSKIVGVVAWDCQIAQIVDRAGVELVSVGDSVGVNLWGQKEGEITLEEMLIVCKAVRRGVKRALLSCDLPPAFIGPDNARRLVDAGADMVKIEGPAEAVSRIAGAGIAVFAEFHGGRPKQQLVEEAKRLEAAGAALLDFRHSGPEAGAAVVQAVSIPVLGGLGGGPWLDGRLRMAHAAIGYAAAHLDAQAETYANVARVTLEAISAYAEDVRAGRHLKGQRA